MKALAVWVELSGGGEREHILQQEQVLCKGTALARMAKQREWVAPFLGFFTFQSQFPIFHGLPPLFSFFFYIIGSRHLQRLPAFHIGKRFICARVAIIAKWFLGFCKHGKALGPDPVSGPGF